MDTRVSVIRNYKDALTGKDATVDVTVRFDEQVNKAALLMELGVAMVCMVEKLSGEAEPAAFSDLSVSGFIADDLIFWHLLGLVPENNGKLKAKQ